jgi:hypothetical protein
MMKPNSLMWTALVVGFFAFLAWTTLSAQKVECTVCVEFNGKRNCATASHKTDAEATRSAQTTACGPITSGMNDAIACDAKPAVERQCTGT